MGKKRPNPGFTLSLDEIDEGIELPPLRVSEELNDDDDTWVDLLETTRLGE